MTLKKQIEEWADEFSWDPAHARMFSDGALRMAQHLLALYGRAAFEYDVADGDKETDKILKQLDAYTREMFIK